MFNKPSMQHKFTMHILHVLWWWGYKEGKSWFLFSIKSLWDKLWTFLRPVSQESSTVWDMQKSHQKWLPDEKGILFCISLELRSYQEAYNMLQGFQWVGFLWATMYGCVLQRKGEFVLCGETAALFLLDAGGRKPPVSKLKRKASTNLLLLGSAHHTCHNSGLCSRCCRMDHSETLKVEVWGLLEQSSK